MSGAPLTTEINSIQTYTSDLISKITEQENRYRDLISKNAPRRGSAEKEMDISPELTDFMWFIDKHIKNRYGLEYALKLLNSNLNPKAVRHSGEAPSLKFRIEPTKDPHVYQTKAAPSNQVSRLDLTIIDLLAHIPLLKNRIICEKYVLRDKGVARLVRINSEKSQLGFFKNTAQGKIAARLFETLLDLVQSLEPLRLNVIELINRSPLMDLEHGFDDVNPDDCRKLIRGKFQSLLPGLNDDRQRVQQQKTHLMRQIRTIKTMNKFEREFQTEIKKMADNLKQVLALRFWITKLLITVLRNNQISDSSGTDKPKARKSTLNVAINFTIGDLDPEQFLINPLDIIAVKESFQRTSKKDQWVSVNTSEKMLRLNRNDFFTVLKDFFENDLNPLLNRFGLTKIDFINQLIPEIQERIEDIEHIYQIRSAILGTSITNADDFIANYRFHNLFRQFFQTSDHSKTEYLYREKFNLIAGEMHQSNLSILRIKYRKIKAAKVRIESKIEQLIKHLNNSDTPKNEMQSKIRLKHLKNLLPILRTIIQVMEAANPTLEEVKTPQR